MRLFDGKGQDISKYNSIKRRFLLGDKNNVLKIQRLKVKSSGDLIWKWEY